MYTVSRKKSKHLSQLWQTMPDFELPPVCTSSHLVVSNPGRCKHDGIFYYWFQNWLLQLTVNWNLWTKPGQTTSSVKCCSYCLQCQSSSIEFWCAILTSLVTCLSPNWIQDRHYVSKYFLMKFGSSFRYIQKQVHIILSGCIQIWHFYRTLSRGLLFSWTQCRFKKNWYKWHETP